MVPLNNKQVLINKIDIPISQESKIFIINSILVKFLIKFFLLYFYACASLWFYKKPKHVARYGQ